MLLADSGPDFATRGDPPGRLVEFMRCFSTSLPAIKDIG